VRSSLAILRRAAWAPGIEGEAGWADWAAGSIAIEASSAVPDLPFLPPLFKRRLGQLDRMVLLVGHEALGAERPAGPKAAARTLLATRRGELGQQWKISAALAETGEVSPAAFSLSVFNAPISLLSIAEVNKGSSCATHAGEHSFAAGLCCCAGMLARDPEPVLLIAADELAPEAYAELGPEAKGAPHALTLLLGRGGSGGEELVLEAGTAGPEAAGGEPEALAFFRWLLAGEGELRLGGEEWPIALTRARPGSPR
jgi:hypothetical protein